MKKVAHVYTNRMREYEAYSRKCKTWKMRFKTPYGKFSFLNYLKPMYSSVMSTVDE